VTGQQLVALRNLAALSRFNLWCPLVDATDAGDALIRLGVEYSVKNDAVRLNSGLLCRAILAREDRAGEVRFSSPGAARPTAIRVITQYLRATLLAPHRQRDVIITLSRIRYDRRLFTSVVNELSQASRRLPSVWDRWADAWDDLASVVQILSFLRTTLPSLQAGDLGNRFCRYVVENTIEHIPLPTAVAALELLRGFYRGRRRPTELVLQG